MPRSASGLFTLAESPFVAGTVIRSSPVNNDLSDIATALTQSLATTGVSVMTGPIKSAAGSVSAPGYTFAAALGTGLVLTAADEFAVVNAGVLTVTFNADHSVDFEDNVNIAGDLFVAGNVDIDGEVIIDGHPVTNFPVGTIMTFFQTLAPIGWTKLTVDINDRAMRFTSDTADGAGADGFLDIFGSGGWATEGHTLTESEIPAHGHTYRTHPGGGGTDNNGGFLMSNDGGSATNQAAFNGTPSDTLGQQIGGNTGGGGSHDHDLDLEVFYLSWIVAERDA